MSNNVIVSVKKYDYSIIFLQKNECIFYKSLFFLTNKTYQDKKYLKKRNFLFMFLNEFRDVLNFNWVGKDRVPE